MIHRNPPSSAKALCFQTGVWLFVLIILAGGASAGDESEALKRSESLLNKGWYMEALGRLQDIVEHGKDPDVKARALFIIGQTYESNLDQKEIALVYYENVMATFPKSAAAADALLSSGVIYFDQKNYPKAHAVFTQYMDAYPKSMRYKSAAAWADIAKPLIGKTAVETVPSVPAIPPAPKPRPAIPVAEPVLRILTHQNTNPIKVSGAQPITVALGEDREKIYSGRGPVVFSVRSNQMSLNGKTLPISVCRVESAGPALELNGKSYRGAFTISMESGGLSAINHVSAEKYLYGVMPSEMPSDWPMEALMAQAVAARTYALYMREKNIQKSFDLEADTASQVYGGFFLENQRASLAVDKTRGQVMTHDGRLIAAYYHSNSGGHTEDPCDVWNARIPYLRAIPDQYSTGSMNGDWEYFLSFEDAARRLREGGLRIRHVAQLRVAGKSRSGRNLKVLVVSEKGVTPLSSSQFRMTMGETKVKSTLFNMVPYAKGILFKGRGYGHGVGMSQWGAKRMAGLGSSYREILRYYYQGVQIVSLSS